MQHNFIRVVFAIEKMLVKLAAAIVWFSGVCKSRLWNSGDLHTPLYIILHEKLTAFVFNFSIHVVGKTDHGDFDPQ